MNFNGVSLSITVAQATSAGRPVERPRSQRQLQASRLSVVQQL